MGACNKHHLTCSFYCKIHFIPTHFLFLLIVFTQSTLFAKNSADFPINTGLKPCSTFYYDADGDGYGDTNNYYEGDAAPDGFVDNDDDCDDGNFSINPAATEICNGLDDNCDGSIDEGVQSSYYEDLDDDGYGTINDVVFACEVPDGYATNKDDCNDNDENINPEAQEFCNEIDDNCDGNTDEGVQSSYYQDLDGDGYGTINDVVFACEVPDGYATNKDDCNDNDNTINPNAEETCDAFDVDEDCDGFSDNYDFMPAGQLIYYYDEDNDGYGDASNFTNSCDPLPGFVNNNTDCDPLNANINPGEEEMCDANNIDEDCDGVSDNLDYMPVGQTTFYLDADSDGYGDAGQVTMACDQPNNFVTNATDCNDNNAEINPGAEEQCDALNTDEDCDGVADNLDYMPVGQSTFYHDGDSDGYGDAGESTMACDQPYHFVTNGTDCDDTNSNVNPGATEICNTIDDNCNNVIDEGVLLSFFQDNDLDGYGSNTIVLACTEGPGKVNNSNDCNDNNAAIKPGATEVCNDVDDDCDNTIDEGVRLWFYLDNDLDGYGSNTIIYACSGGPGKVYNHNDCNDNNAAVKPGAAEVCNGIDDDCDNKVDEYLTTKYYEDSDADNLGDAGSYVFACSAPSGYVTNKNDNCPDDHNPNQYDIDDDGDGDVCDEELDICDAADELIDDIYDACLSYNLRNSLITKIEQAIDKFEDNKKSQAINKLNSFISQVNSKKGSDIPTATANYWIYVAQQMITHINANTADCHGGGCRKLADEDLLVQSLENSIKLFPNPTTDFVNIFNDEVIQKLIITQINGASSAFEINVQEDESKNVVLDLSEYGLSTGVYIISVHSETKVKHFNVTFNQ